MQKTEIKGHSREEANNERPAITTWNSSNVTVFQSISRKTKEPITWLSILLHVPRTNHLHYLFLNTPTHYTASLAFRLTAIAFLSICKWYIAAAKARLQAELPKSPIMGNHSSSLLQFPAILENWFFLNRLLQIKLENYIKRRDDNVIFPTDYTKHA